MTPGQIDQVRINLDRQQEVELNTGRDFLESWLAVARTVERNVPVCNSMEVILCVDLDMNLLSIDPGYQNTSRSLNYATQTATSWS